MVVFDVLKVGKLLGLGMWFIDRIVVVGNLFFEGNLS